MNIQDTANAKSAYAIGQPVKRKEDSTLLRGQGRYTDDINPRPMANICLSPPLKVFAN